MMKYGYGRCIYEEIYLFPKGNLMFRHMVPSAYPAVCGKQRENDLFNNIVFLALRCISHTLGSTKTLHPALTAKFLRHCLLSGET